MITDLRMIPLGKIICNCYLIKTEKRFVLVDTGRKSKRRLLEGEMAEAGCTPGNLDLIFLTHGDFDHTGNSAYLREKYGAKIAMHASDAGMVEQGDMFLNRKAGWFARKMVNTLFKIERFTPDLLVDEDTDLSQFGLDARVIHIPGHSSGSIGILTSKNDLICGDLFSNTKRPELNTIVDDPELMGKSMERVMGLDVGMVYPGHGAPFAMSSLENDT